ncbi:MAG TPA: carboxy terminal-processing peptidase [Moraxellaceae bacterium]|nr:carboxy terminal-processing peptidase [Moraxellaceae bacterium]
MPALLSRKFLLATLAASSLVVFSGVFAKQATAPTTHLPLTPSKVQARTARDTVSLLDEMHYEHRVLDDKLSSQVFDRFLKDLDSQHIYFLASDVQAFEPYRLTLDNALKKGDLRAAFLIYNRYLQRTRERLEFVLAELDKGVGAMDFGADESLEVDREKSPWVANRAAMDELWRKRIKAAALSLRLAGKADKDIQTTLTKRYKSQLNNITRTKADDGFQAFMNSFAESYDPHTEYFSPRTEENFNINMSLSLEGIGAVLQSEDEFTKVVRLVPAGPADKGKQLKTGDRIVAVAQGDQDFVDVVGWRIDEVVELIRGPKGTTVRLQVIPAGSVDETQTRVVSIVRNTVKLEDQAAQKKILTLKQGETSYKIGVIKLPAFYADFQGMQAGDPEYRSTTRDVKRLINELKAEKINGLVLDLRNNGGGSLSEANSLIGLFIGTGPTVQVRNAAGKAEQLVDPDPSVTYSGPLAVMTNRLSASAAEIVAGAIQDYGRGLVIGSTTFGKGTVQSLRDLEYGQLKLTEAKFYRISGASTQHRGVNADVVFPNIFDDEDVGESALPNAMPWDTIPSARYVPYQDYSRRLPELRRQSEERQARDPDFRYLNESIALAHELKKIKTLSLNEATRRKEKADLDARRLAMENRRRTAKGEALLKSWKEAEDKAEEEAQEAAEPGQEKPEEEAFALEAARVLIDSFTPHVSKR